VDGKAHAVAAGLPAYRPVFTGDLSSLIVTGLEIDAVTKITDIVAQEDFQTSKTSSEYHSYSNLWVRRIEQLVGLPTEYHLEALAWTMTAGKDWADQCGYR